MKKKNKILILILIVVLAIGTVAYFVLSKPADTNRQAAASHIQNLQTSHSTIKAQLASIKQSGDINETLARELNEAASQYNSELSALQNNPALSTDSKLKSMFDQYRGNLTEYGASATSLGESLKRYSAILTNCTDLVLQISTISTTAEFDSTAKSCSDSIKDAASAPYEPFRTQFLDNYTSRASDLLEAYRNKIEIGAKNATEDTAFLTLVKNEITKLSQQKLDLTISPDPSDDILRLKNEINS